VEPEKSTPLKKDLTSLVRGVGGPYLHQKNDAVSNGGKGSVLVRISQLILGHRLSLTRGGIQKQLWANQLWSYSSVG